MQQLIKYILLVFVVGILSCDGPKDKLAKLLNNPANGLQQTNKQKNRSVEMELLPQKKEQQQGSGVYKVRLTLKSNEKITGYAEMQYMNFDIKNSIYAVQGKDTMRCMVCERIPGINEKDFLYLTLFDKQALAKHNNSNLRICINDSLAGWGNNEFEIRNDIIKKLETIKY